MRKFVAFALVIFIFASCTKQVKQSTPLSMQETIALMKDDPDVTDFFTTFASATMPSELTIAAEKLSGIIKWKYPAMNAKGEGGKIISALFSEFYKRSPHEVVSEIAPIDEPTDPTSIQIGYQDPKDCLKQVKSDMNDCDIDAGLTIVGGLGGFAGGLAGGIVSSFIGTATAIYQHKRCLTRAEIAFKKCLETWKNHGSIRIPGEPYLEDYEALIPLWVEVYIEIPEIQPL